MRKKVQVFRSRGVDLAFDAINLFLLIILLVVIAYPLYFLVLASFSEASAVTNGQVWLWPKGFNLDSYKKILDYQVFWTGYRNTAIYTLLSTIIGVTVTMMAAYPLSFSNLPGKSWLMFLFVFTMFFSGGLVPTYMTVRSLDLTNTPTIVIILGCFSTYNLIITRTFLQSSIPRDLYEAAEIDGAGYAGCFFRIVLPLSKPIFAVLVIYIAAWQWNSYFNALIYLSDRKYITLQLVLREILTSQQQLMQQLQDGSMDQDMDKATKLAESIKYAIVIVSSLPIMCLYPFMQKYFVKGLFIGSIKG